MSILAKLNTWSAAALLLFGSYAGTSKAAVLEVSNCNDSGPGSLRAALNLPHADGDTVDMTRLQCGRIALTSGTLGYSGVGTLSVIGPGRDALVIDAGLRSAIFYRSLEGLNYTLRLSGMTLTNGIADGGGCVRSGSNVELRNVRIHHCQARGPGGAVFALGNVSAYHTIILSNQAGSDAESEGGGGGIYVNHHLILDHSRVSGNEARGGGGIVAGTAKVTYSLIDHNTAGSGGGIDSSGAVEIYKSTIADNHAASVGGLFVHGYGDETTLITDSTISRNSGGPGSGAMIFGEATIANSTVAFNREGDGTSMCQGALFLEGPTRLESNIIASNSCLGMHPLDLSGEPDTGAVVVGSHNLIGKYSLPVPLDTLSLPPRLGPLANNGGLTPTHALLCSSPAIDRGNNVLHLAYDQRGPGYPRVKGARADIGAYEY